MRARTLLDPLLETDGWASVWSTSDYSSLTRGIVRYYQGRLDEAVEHLTAALASSYPDRKPRAIAAYLLAWIMSRRGNQEAARILRRQAEHLEDDDALTELDQQIEELSADGLPTAVASPEILP